MTVTDISMEDCEVLVDCVDNYKIRLAVINDTNKITVGNVDGKREYLGIEIPAKCKSKFTKILACTPEEAIIYNNLIHEVVKHANEY